MSEPEAPRDWWSAFAHAGGLADLETWLGGIDAKSRVRIRERCAEAGYGRILDCGAGLGLDYIGFRGMGLIVDWQGVEQSAAMRAAAHNALAAYSKGEKPEEVPPPPIVEGSIEELPFKDRSFEFVYCRHVLEHLPTFERALGEMIRVASHEVAAVFFIRPQAEAYLLRERDGLWHNRYALSEIDEAIWSNPGVVARFWEHLDLGESILHVMLEGARQVNPELVRQRVQGAGGD